MQQGWIVVREDSVPYFRGDTDEFFREVVDGGLRLCVRVSRVRGRQTRSRSGMLEKQLKLGLLSTSIEAQRNLYLENPEGEVRKIFAFAWLLDQSPKLC